MNEYPKPRTGLTDMSAPLMRFEAAILSRRFQATGIRDTILPPPVKRQIIEKM